MRDHSNHIELSREDAVEQILAAVGQVSFGVERVDVTQSVGRVTAHDVCAVCDMPAVLTCMMDSIAVHWKAFGGLSEGEVPDTTAWVRGQDWQFANTGVAMPEGFDTAIMIEQVEVSADEQQVSIRVAPPHQYAGTRAAGSSMHAGDVLVPAGSVITPELAAVIASGNHASVAVVRKPRVAFIPTGNELIAPGVPYDANRPESFAARRCNFETNSILVRGKVEAWGGIYVPFDIVSDTRTAIKDALLQAVEVADIVVLNAGSSKGSDDWSCEVLEELGQVICHQTNHGPGRHSSYAVIAGVPVVGISGPSGGASFTLDFYLRPVMRHFLGLEAVVPKVPARLAAELPPHHGPGGPGGSGGPHGGHGPHGPHGGHGLGGPHGGHGPGGPGGPHGGPGPDGGRGPHDADGKKPSFFGIRMLRVETASDGTLEAYPVAGKPDSPQARLANAFCMVPVGSGVKPPEVGSTVMVEFR